MYKPNAAVLCDIAEDVLEVVIISTIYIVNQDMVFFKGKTYNLLNYNRHFRAHILTATNKEAYVRHDALIHYIPLHPRVTRVLPDHTIIILPFYISQ